MLNELILLSSGSGSSSPGSSWYLQTSIVSGENNHEYSRIATDRYGNLYSVNAGGSSSASISKIDRLGNVVFTKLIPYCQAFAISNDYIFFISPNATSFTVARMTLDGISSTYTLLQTPEPCYVGLCAAVAEENTLIALTSYWSEYYESLHLKLFKVSESSDVARVTEIANVGTGLRGSSFRSGSSLFIANGMMYTLYKINLNGSINTIFYTAVDNIISNLQDVAGNDNFVYFVHGEYQGFTFVTCMSPSTNAILWSRKITHSFNKALCFSTCDALGNVYVAVNVHNSPNVWVHKFNSSGDLVWCIKIYDSSSYSASNGSGCTMACDLTNNDIYLKICGSNRTNYLRLNSVSPPITTIGTILTITNETPTITTDAFTALSPDIYGSDIGNLRARDVFNTTNYSNTSNGFISLNNI